MTDVKENAMRKNKRDVSQVLMSQTETVRKCAKDSIRKFSKVPVEVDTINGKPLVFNVWASKEKFIHKKKMQNTESNETSIQQEGFDDTNQDDAYLCSVCGKKFSEQKNLTLHLRYHKD